MVKIIGSGNPDRFRAYAESELARVLAQLCGLPVEVDPAAEPGDDTGCVVIGTVDSNPLIARLISDRLLEAETRPQGYSIRCGAQAGGAGGDLLVIAGADDAGVLYAVRDLEHFERGRIAASRGRLACAPFARREFPRIEHRGHWVWGCHMPDKKAWLDNMSRWKLNELIHWDNEPPARAAEYVEHAHSRGIRVAWGFGWGWAPDWNFDLPDEFDRGTGDGVLMCGSSQFNREFFRREIPARVRQVYVPTGCDGIYFQSFTETPICQCRRCHGKTMGQLMLDFVNPIVDAIKAEFPQLWISCGIHADFGTYDELVDLDPRCNIYWENCDSGTSLRGEDEDFGYINKSIPYAHGFSDDCPADPDYTEESLQEWMRNSEKLYALPESRESHYTYMESLQGWGSRFLDKRSSHKHSSCVADHSVFCRQTPFIHVAYAEALWNPERNTRETVDAIAALGISPPVGQPHPRVVDVVGEAW